MDFFEYIKLAFRSLRANKIRALLTMLGIIIGVASVILLVSIGTGLQRFVTQQFESLGSNNIYVLPGKVDLTQGPSGGPMASVSKFEFSDATELRRLGDPIANATPMTQVSATLRYRGELARPETSGVWEDAFAMMNLEVEQGELFTQADVERTKKVIVLGSKAAEDLFGVGISAVGKTITVNESQYKVIGVLKSKGGGGGIGANIDNQAYMPLSTALRQFDQTNPYMLMVTATSQESVTDAATAIERHLLRRLKEDDFTVLEQTELLSTITQFLGTITMALGGIAAISLVVGGIGIMNIMLVTVTERTREIGLRKAVGARGRDILLQFLIEAIILSLVGGLLGIALGSLGALALSQFIQTSVSAWSVFLSFSVSAGIGILFGVAPAVRASRLNPIDALRYE